MDLVRQISWDILLIGGAIGVILVIIALVFWIRLAFHLSKLAKSIKAFTSGIDKKVDSIIIPMSNMIVMLQKTLNTKTTKEKKVTKPKKVKNTKK